MTSDALIAVQGVSKKFCRDHGRSLRYAVWDALRDLSARGRADAALRRDEFWALRNISFDVRRGESLAIMGVNGAGKSTLLKTILGSLRLSEGRIVTRGRVAALSEHGLGFDPLLTGRENVYMSAAVLEIDRRRVDAAFDDIVAFAQLEAFIDSPVRMYSTGMRSRLGFAVAMHLEPDILLVDEVLAVGDLGFQRRCMEHAQRYLRGGGSLVLVSHNAHLVQFICARCLVLDRGAAVFDGDVVAGVARYLDLARVARGDLVTLDAALTDPSRVAAAPAIEDGGIAIDDLAIHPLAAASLRTGEPAQISVRYRSERDTLVRWGFCLLTADLETTIACDALLDPFPIAAGTGVLSATVPRLPLVGGRYALKAAIMDPRTELPFALRGFHDPPRYFTVDMPVSLRNNYRMFTNDLVALDGLAWEPAPASTGVPLTAFGIGATRSARTEPV